MQTPTDMMKATLLFFGFILLNQTCLNAQVKIGDNANTINVNSMLELESTNKGFLPPRIALNNLNAVTPLTSTTPSGMLIYSSGGTVSDGYYYWNAAKWIPLNNASTRSNYVLVKSETDFPAPVGGIINLVAGTLYEINGTITVSSKINLNGCEIHGSDVVNDKLIYTGAAELFTGSLGGTIQTLSFIASGGKVFDLNGGGANVSLIMYNCYFISCNTIGTIAGMGGYVYLADIGYYLCSNGITFQNDNYVYLNSSVWDISNTNTFEKFIGAFSIIQILGGSRNVSSGNKALDISGITSVTNGSVKSSVFNGNGTYVNGTFSNSWEVEAIGLNTEKDDVSSGNIYITTTSVTSFVAVNTATKVLGTTTSTNLFRTSSTSNNRLTYTGAKTKKFLVICALSFTSAGNNKIYSFYVTKNGVKLPESKISRKINTGTDQGATPISCTVTLAPNDYIEVWVENNTDITSITVESMNLAIK